MSGFLLLTFHESDFRESETKKLKMLWKI